MLNTRLLVMKSNTLSVTALNGKKVMTQLVLMQDQDKKNTISRPSMVSITCPGLGKKAHLCVEAERCLRCGIELHKDPGFAEKSWLRIVYEAVKCLHNERQPHSKFFHYKRDICSYIDKHWSALCPQKKRTSTWNNTVSAVITTHRGIFQSNQKQSGFWTLRPTSEDDLYDTVGSESPNNHEVHSLASPQKLHSPKRKSQDMYYDEFCEEDLVVSPPQPLRKRRRYKETPDIWLRSTPQKRKSKNPKTIEIVVPEYLYEKAMKDMENIRTIPDDILVPTWRPVKCYRSECSKLLKKKEFMKKQKMDIDRFDPLEDFYSFCPQEENMYDSDGNIVQEKRERFEDEFYHKLHSPYEQWERRNLRPKREEIRF
mmetsp:Transcript_3671/g.4070  ORF Transcript_3671/g.4070 Transcript_3671/m.4070 type:complete len:370 (+) Transcript_3671:84-1193(+)